MKGNEKEINLVVGLGLSLQFIVFLVFLKREESDAGDCCSLGVTFFFILSQFALELVSSFSQMHLTTVVNVNT